MLRYYRFRERDLGKTLTFALDEDDFDIVVKQALSFWDAPLDSCLTITSGEVEEDSSDLKCISGFHDRILVVTLHDASFDSKQNDEGAVTIHQGDSCESNQGWTLTDIRED